MKRSMPANIQSGVRRSRSRGRLRGSGLIRAASTSTHVDPTDSTAGLSVQSTAQKGNSRTECYKCALMAKKLAVVEEERDELIDKIAELKTMVTRADDRCREEGAKMLALTSHVKMSEEEINSLRAENKSLKHSRDDLIQNSAACGRRTQASRSGGRFISSLENRFLGVACDVEKSMISICRKEVSELDLFSEVPERSWARRCVHVQKYGLRLKPDSLCAPLHPTSVSLSRKYFTPSTVSDQALLELVLQKILSGMEWTQVFTEEDKKYCSEQICGNKGIMKRLKQCLSDTLGANKRRARDALFEGLQYHTLRSRHRPMTDSEKSRRDLELIDARMRLLGASDGNPSLKSIEVTKISNWRTEKVEFLKNSHASCEPGTTAEQNDNIDISSTQEEALHEGDENLSMVATPLAVDVLHAFMGYNPEDGEPEITKGSIMWLCRCDAWVATVLLCLQFCAVRTDENELIKGPGGGVQKMYIESYGQLLQLSVQNFLASVADYVREWHPEELLPERPFTEETVASFLSMDREATVIIQGVQDDVINVAVTEKFFSTYCTDAIGKVHDCFVSSVNTSTMECSYITSIRRNIEDSEA